MAKPVEVLRAAALEAVPHGFLTRMADASEPDADLVIEAGELVLLRQVHSADAVIVEAPFVQSPEADAMATAVPGLVLGIVTADCAPVLLADRAAGVIGAAHAGWRGAHAGVIAAVVGAMESLGASRQRIAAAIGPTIAPESYEVDQPFRERFAAEDAPLFAPGRKGHYRFDLPAYVARRLREAGVGQVEDLRVDTYRNAARFHSYRRATHDGEAAHGRQFSIIGLPGELARP